MKKEILSGALLALLIALSVFNLAYLRDFTCELSARVEESRDFCERGDYGTAEVILREALELWLSAEDYTHIFIRHTEVDATGGSFYDLLGSLRAGDGDTAAGLYEKLASQIKSLYTMDRPSFGSIF